MKQFFSREHEYHLANLNKELACLETLLSINILPNSDRIDYKKSMILDDVCITSIKGDNYVN